MKPITEMTDEELQAEVLRYQSIKIPSAPVAKAPKKPTKEGGKGGRKKASWRDQMGM